MSLRPAVLGLVLITALTACGGGHGSAAPPATPTLILPSPANLEPLARYTTVKQIRDRLLPGFVIACSLEAPHLPIQDCNLLDGLVRISVLESADHERLSGLLSISSHIAKQHGRELVLFGPRWFVYITGDTRDATPIALAIQKRLGGQFVDVFEAAKGAPSCQDGKPRPRAPLLCIE